MKTRQDRKSSGLFNVTTTDIYTTDDGKEFTNRIEAEKWEWYLKNKNRVHNDYQFIEISPMALGLSFIVNPVFAYRFNVDDAAIRKGWFSDIVFYASGLVKEMNVHLTKDEQEKLWKTHIKHQNEGWYAVILDNHIDKGHELHVFHMKDLVRPRINDELKD